MGNKIVKLGGQEFELVDFGIGNHHELQEMNAVLLKPIIKAKRPPKTIRHLGHKYVLAKEK